MNKLCNKCSIEQPIKNFYFQQNRYVSICKNCWYILYSKNKRKKVKDKFGLGGGTISRYGFKLSLDVYKKFNGKCKECRSDNDLTIHHLDHKGRNYYENGLKRNDDIDNLVVLCRSCHGRLHSIERWNKKKG